MVFKKMWCFTHEIRKEAIHLKIEKYTGVDSKKRHCETNKTDREYLRNHKEKERDTHV